MPSDGLWWRMTQLLWSPYDSAPQSHMSNHNFKSYVTVFNQPYLHRQVPIKNIERELICPICKELFTHPLILPCQHSVCHKCVRELLMMNHEDSFDAGSECSMPGSPRSRVPSPSMERLDRLVRSGASWCGGKGPKYSFFQFFADKLDFKPLKSYYSQLYFGLTLICIHH